MKSIRILLVFLTITSAQAQRTRSVLPGEFAVGYKSTLIYDPGRPALTGQLSPDSGRAIFLSIWYPAKGSKKKQRISSRYYFDEVVKMDGAEQRSNASQTEKEVLRLLSQLGGDTTLFKASKSTLYEYPALAFLDAPAMRRDFPVIVYPEYPHLNSIMAESIASHGYYVVSVSRNGTTDSNYEWQTVRGMETRIHDYQCALAYIKKSHRISISRLAFIGLGMTASDGLLWTMREPRLKAFVSLEGGVLTRFEFDMLKLSPYYSIAQANRPLLLFHSPHPDVNPDLAESYKHADRYLAGIKNLSEFYYLNFGFWEAEIPGLLGKAPGNTQPAFRYVLQRTIEFLDWQLKGSENQKNNFLSDSADVQNVIRTFLPAIK